MRWRCHIAARRNPAKVKVVKLADLLPFFARPVKGVVCIEGVGDDGTYRTFAGIIEPVDDKSIRLVPLLKRHPLAGKLTYTGDGLISIGQITSLVTLP